MELYTSLTRLKMAMNGQALPPMTALTVRARGLLDPSFTPGMGALEARKSDGALRCPIRGCGQYYHYLTAHLSAHKVSARVLRDVLGIPQSAGLVSERVKSEKRSRHIPTGKPHTSETRRRAQARRQKTLKSSMMRNLQDACDEQLRGKLLALTQKLGRAPTVRQMVAEYGKGLRWRIERIFGTFNACKEHLGFRTYHGRPRKRAAA